MRSARSGRRPRSEKMKSFTPTFTEMRATYPVTLLPLIDRMEKGSLKAATTLKCLECSGFQRAEVRNCACPGCSLYPFRPGATELANLPETPEEQVEEQEEEQCAACAKPVAAPVAPYVDPLTMGATPVAEPEAELTAEEQAIMAELNAEAKAALAALDAVAA